MSKEDSAKVEEFKRRFGNKPTVRQDPETIERRRKNVWEMAVEGVPQTTMAKILCVSRMTIYSDLDVIEKRNQAHAHALKNDSKAAELDIGNTVKTLQTIGEQAMAKYAESESAQDKDRFLNTAMKAYVSRNRVLVETGFLPKAGIEVKQTVEHTVSFEEKFGKYKIMDDAASRRRVLAVAEAALKYGLQASPETKQITVDAQVISPEKKDS